MKTKSNKVRVHVITNNSKVCEQIAMLIEDYFTYDVIDVIRNTDHEFVYYLYNKNHDMHIQQ